MIRRLVWPLAPFRCPEYGDFSRDFHDVSVSCTRARFLLALGTVRPLPIFSLDEPHYHAVRLGERERFRGVALAAEGAAVTGIIVYREGNIVAEAAANLECPELAWLPVPRANQCRFDFELLVEGGAPYEINGRCEDGTEIPLFLYDVGFVKRKGDRLDELWQCVSLKPVPPPEVVAITQGIGNVDAYRASTASGLLKAERLLVEAGVRPEGMQSILDIGCGTGRLLVGWHCDNPRRRLVGVDINADLIGWACENLAHVAEWNVSAMNPPLALPDASFDLVQLVSVFTHLSIACQRAWLKEIRRLLRPDGHAMISLQGEIYATVLLNTVQREQYHSEGYVEILAGAEGENSFATFHTETFARELFRDFGQVTFYRRGMVGPVARMFPLASLQDVYILGGSFSL